MSARIACITASLLLLTGCVVTPRIEMAENINFDAPLPERTPMSYDDLLCCYDCQA